MTTLSSTDHMGPHDQYVTRDSDVNQLSGTPPMPLTAPGGRAPVQSDPFLSPPLEPDELGRLGPYRVLRLLGRGGMGIVYQAEDIGLGRPVAIKILKQELADQGDSWDRFLREARTLASIKHEHVVTVYHTGREGKVAYLVMELLQGCSLAEHLVNVRKPSVVDILRLGRELAAGLAVVHDHGLIHRDMKPANVWVEAPEGRIKILDFGLARMVREDARLTQTGVVVGTPAYMSPEQARGLEVDQRSDLFSLGCILYRLCTGLEPFRGPDTMSLLTALAVDTPDPVEKLNPTIPKGLGDLVMHLLAKKPADRPATAKDVVARLEALERSPDKPVAPSNTQKVVPPADAAIAERSNTWASLRLGVLLGGGLLAGVIGGYFALQTPASPSRPTKDKAPVVAEAPRDTVDEAEPSWQTEQRRQMVGQPIQAVAKHVEAEQKAPELKTPPQKIQTQKIQTYLTDMQPTAFFVGAAPMPAQGAGARGVPPPFIPPPPPPPPGPRGPKDRSPRGGPGWPPPGEGMNGLPPEIAALLGGGGANGPASLKEMLTGALGYEYLRVNGKTAAHGLGMRASFLGKSYARYELQRPYETFQTEVSLNDTSNFSPVGLTFTVYGNNELLWQSRAVTTRNDSQKCKVPLRGVQVLELTVTNSTGDMRTFAGADSIWVDPLVIGR